jgi:hypothetical protein
VEKEEDKSAPKPPRARGATPGLFSCLCRTISEGRLGAKACELLATSALGRCIPTAPPRLLPTPSTLRWQALLQKPWSPYVTPTVEARFFCRTCMCPCFFETEGGNRQCPHVYAPGGRGGGLTSVPHGRVGQWVRIWQAEWGQAASMGREAAQGREPGISHGYGEAGARV